MNSRNAPVYPLLLVLALGLTPITSAWAAKAAEIAASAEADNAQVMERWTESREQFDAMAASYKKDPAKAKQVADFSRQLDEAGIALEEVLSLTAVAAPNSKKVAAAVNVLKGKLQALSIQQAKLKSDPAFTRSAGNVMSVLGGALAQRMQATQSAVKNLR